MNPNCSCSTNLLLFKDIFYYSDSERNFCRAYCGRMKLQLYVDDPPQNCNTRVPFFYFPEFLIQISVQVDNKGPAYLYMLTYHNWTIDSHCLEEYNEMKTLIKGLSSRFVSCFCLF